MRHISIVLFISVLLLACNDEIDNPDNLRILSVNDIKQEYYTADSLNNLEDRSNIDTSTLVLGIDGRNGKYVIRTCLDRGFGCLLFSDYHTILYQDCDSVSCENNGNWVVDYVGIAGSPSSVGCEPDTIQ